MFPINAYLQSITTTGSAARHLFYCLFSSTVFIPILIKRHASSELDIGVEFPLVSLHLWRSYTLPSLRFPGGT